MITVRRIKAVETELLKQMRLSALQDAPYAFETTYETAKQRSAETWRGITKSIAQGSDKAIFIAFSEDEPIGMAALFRSKDAADEGELMQVWVGPEYRGTRAAWELMDTIFKWAQQNDFHRIIAGVTKVNARALKFYFKYGFSMYEHTSPDNPDGVYLVKEVK